MSAVRLIRRVPWLDNLLSTQVSFALGALCVFIPFYPALVRQEQQLEVARQAAHARRDATLAQPVGTKQGTTPADDRPEQTSPVE